MVRIMDSAYANVELEHVAYNAVQLNADERTKLIGLLNWFEYLFYVTLVEWDTEPI